MSDQFSIRVTARSDEEFDMRINDNIKRGYELVATDDHIRRNWATNRSKILDSHLSNVRQAEMVKIIRETPK